jgi:Holliday junction resolvasome RuvABC endonuclease subunit
VSTLALDLGTHTGWACSCYPVVRSGVYNVPKHEQIGMRFNAFRTWLTSILREHDVVAYEKAYVMPRGASTELFFGFMAILAEETAVRDIELVPVNAMRLKKWTTGYGRASKALMLEHVNARWRVGLYHKRGDCPKWCPDPSHDEADAIAILHHFQEVRHG